MERKKDAILVLCAHNDDHVIGIGGTIAKYRKKGIDVITVIFSYGESTHPWLKKKEVIKMRVDESHKADKVIGGKKLYYLGLKEGKFNEEINKKDIKKKIKSFISVIRPMKIFTHAEDDPHPDHRAVHQTTMKIIDQLNYNCDVYSFDIWNPFSVRNRDRPVMVVNIEQTFDKKIEAIKKHESQWMALVTMIPAIYLRAIFNGLERGFKYAEVFAKLR